MATTTVEQKQLLIDNEWRASASGDTMDVAVPLQSIDIRKTNLGWDREGRVLVEQPYPLPATITGLTGTLDVTEG